MKSALKNQRQQRKAMKKRQRLAFNKKVTNIRRTMIQMDRAETARAKHSHVNVTEIAQEAPAQEVIDPVKEELAQMVEDVRAAQEAGELDKIVTENELIETVLEQEVAEESANQE